MDDHEGLMRRVLELARHGQWRTSPNPLTGALVVRDGRVVAEGHLNERGDHAEAVALDRAARAGGAAGATLYTNLEPCCWTGVGKHTPPCAQRIIREGVRRVVIATADPHPKVDGAGARMLREAGIEVVEHVLEDAAALLNAVHFKFHRTGMPLVTLKIAQSTDGRIATTGGDSRWISDRDARVMTHELRAGHDAIMVGAGTALADDPELTVRLRRCFATANRCRWSLTRPCACRRLHGSWPASVNRWCSPPTGTMPVRVPPSNAPARASPWSAAPRMDGWRWIRCLLPWRARVSPPCWWRVERCCTPS